MLRATYPTRRGLLATLLLVLLQQATALPFWFTSPPEQCGNSTVQWMGGVGEPPYTLLLVPTGHLTPETREIKQLDISSGTSVSFELDYPSGSQFIALMFDARGITSGDTSLVTTVSNSSDAGCLETTPVSPKFVFDQSPSTFSQCGTVTFNLDSTATNITFPLDFVALVPGGQSFLIANVTSADAGTEVSWQANVRSGTEVLIIAGDRDGLGSGGSTDILTVSDANAVSGCINSTSPSSTAGPAAGSIASTSQSGQSGSTGAPGTVNGQSTPTITSATDASTQGSHGHRLAVIVGATMGTVCFIILVVVIALLGYRRRLQPAAYRAMEGNPSPQLASGPGPPSRILLAVRSLFGQNAHPVARRRDMYQPEPYILPTGDEKYMSRISISNMSNMSMDGLLTFPAPSAVSRTSLASVSTMQSLPSLMIPSPDAGGSRTVAGNRRSGWKLVPSNFATRRLRGARSARRCNASPSPLHTTGDSESYTLNVDDAATAVDSSPNSANPSRSEVHMATSVRNAGETDSDSSGITRVDTPAFVQGIHSEWRWGVDESSIADTAVGSSTSDGH